MEAMAQKGEHGTALVKERSYELDTVCYTVFLLNGLEACLKHGPNTWLKSAVFHLNHTLARYLIAEFKSHSNPTQLNRAFAAVDKEKVDILYPVVNFITYDSPQVFRAAQIYHMGQHILSYRQSHIKDEKRVRLIIDTFKPSVEEVVSQYNEQFGRHQFRGEGLGLLEALAWLIHDKVHINAIMPRFLIVNIPQEDNVQEHLQIRLHTNHLEQASYFFKAMQGKDKVASASDEIISQLVLDCFATGLWGDNKRSGDVLLEYKLLPPAVDEEWAAKAEAKRAQPLRVQDLLGAYNEVGV